MREERGSVTLYVLVAMLFFTVLLMGMYVNVGNKAKIEAAAEKRVKELYQEQSNSSSEVYNEAEQKYVESMSGYMTEEDLIAAVNKKKLEIYPINSIYISTSATNPSQYIGGQWEAYGQGRTIVGAGSGYNVNATNGEYQHTLNTNEMPSHSHGTHIEIRPPSKNLEGTIQYPLYMGGESGGSNGVVKWSVSSKRQYTTNGTTTNSWQKLTINATHNHTFSGSMNAAGGSEAHENMQPYITTYMWKRTK